MSHYRKINVEIKNGPSIVAALRDLGLSPEVAADLQQNSISLHNHWSGMGGNMACAVAVQKEALIDSGLVDWAMNGFGFAWNGTGYDLVQDSLRPNILNQIKQRYAVNEAKRLAMVEGYTVTEQQGDDGTIRLVCNKFSPMGEYGGY